LDKSSQLADDSAARASKYSSGTEVLCRLGFAVLAAREYSGPMNDAVEAILKDLLGVMGVEYTSLSQTSVAGQIIFSIQMPGDARTLIGPHGDTIQALDMLVKKIAERRISTQSPDAEAVNNHFLIDVNDFRTKQINDLQTRALMMAERARSFQYDVELTPMSAYERLIVHTTLQDAPNVKTESQGDGRNRRVVIKYSAD
jgi:spoIIIJ-associated protein